MLCKCFALDALDIPRVYLVGNESMSRAGLIIVVYRRSFVLWMLFGLVVMCSHFWDMTYSDYCHGHGDSKGKEPYPRSLSFCSCENFQAEIDF